MSFMRAAASKPESALPPVPVSAILGRGTRRHPQPKLVVSSPTDFHEREADRVASQVMGMPMPPAASHGGNPLNTLSPSSAVERETPAAVRDVLAEPGAPLEPTARDFMEARLGYDFSRVRIHADARASDSARAMGALAYAVGSDVVFAGGAYQPHSHSGRRLIAHELTHVVQQSMSGPAVSRSVAPADAGQSVAPEITPLPAGAPLQRFLSTEPAGGCGVCYGIPANAGKAAHQLIQTEFEILYPLGLVELGVTSPDDENGRLDLAIAVPGGFEIGEIKPANAKGYEDGITQIAKYIGLISARFPGRVIKPLTKLLPPIIFPTLSPKCPVQVLFVNPPVGGVYGYHCQPSFAALKARGCDCPIPRRSQEQEQESEESEKKRKEQAKPNANAPVPIADPAKDKASAVKLVAEFVMIMLASEAKNYDAAARKFLQENPTVARFIVAAGVAVIATLIADDLTLVGIADDVAIPPILLAMWRVATAL